MRFAGFGIEGERVVYDGLSLYAGPPQPPALELFLFSKSCAVSGSNPRFATVYPRYTCSFEIRRISPGRKVQKPACIPRNAAEPPSKY